MVGDQTPVSVRSGGVIKRGEDKFLRSASQSSRKAHFETTRAVHPLPPILLYMNSILWLATVLLVIWLVAKIVFTITGFFLHLLWIASVLLFAWWVFQKVFGSRDKHA